MTELVQLYEFSSPHISHMVPFLTQNLMSEHMHAYVLHSWNYRSHFVQGQFKLIYTAYSKFHKDSNVMTMNFGSDAVAEW